jgi:hypothetical protein
MTDQRIDVVVPRKLKLRLDRVCALQSISIWTGTKEAAYEWLWANRNIKAPQKKVPKLIADFFDRTGLEATATLPFYLEPAAVEDLERLAKLYSTRPTMLLTSILNLWVVQQESKLREILDQ